MTRFARTDTSILGHWWWTIDRWSMAAVALLFVYGVMLTMAASPPVAERLHFEQFHFVRRQLVFLPLAIVIMFAVSLMTPRGIRRLAVMVFAVSILLMIATLFFGPEIKGARRWINIAGLSLQPSEFIKPSLAVVTAWAFARQHKSGEPVWRNVAIGLYVLVVGLLLLQPDFGMTVVVSAVWFGQFFLAGLPMMWVAGFLILGLLGAGGAYFALPHVASRIDRFIDPSSGDSYQVSRSMEAFMNGGLLGRGPGEGSVKSVLPDAHTDFVFAVAGEEFGLIAWVIKEPDLFTLLAVTGLLVQFGLQSLVNMGSTLSLIPTKGMTLPFISYGGSSLTAIALLIGMVLALTRNRRGREAL
jgi:cell division protein FtsW